MCIRDSCSVVPGLRLAAPRDGNQLRQQLREAIDVSDGPTVLRFPKGDVADPVARVRQLGSLDVLRESGPGAVDLLMVGVGAMASTLSPTSTAQSFADLYRDVQS